MKQSDVYMILAVLWLIAGNIRRLSDPVELDGSRESSLLVVLYFLISVVCCICAVAKIRQEESE